MLFENLFFSNPPPQATTQVACYDSDESVALFLIEKDFSIKISFLVIIAKEGELERHFGARNLAVKAVGKHVKFGSLTNDSEKTSMLIREHISP